MSGAQLPGEFDPSQYQPTMGGGNALPISDKKGHLVVITESSFEQTTSGTGNKLVLTLFIQEGPATGQEGNWNLNLGHPNATTVRIAQQELACVCHAVGHIGSIQNTEVLHNKPFRVVVVAQNTEAGKEKGYTNVTKVLRADGSKLTDPPGSAPPQTASGFPTTTAVPPPATSQPGPPTQVQQPPVQPQQAPPAQPAQQPAQPQWQPPAGAQPPAQPPQQGAPPAQPAQNVPWGPPPAQ